MFYSLWHNSKPQKESNILKVKGRCIWESFIDVTARVILDSHSIRWKPVWWPRSSAPSCDRAGQTHRLLLHRAVVSSDKLSYWPAETCSYLQMNHTHVLLCCFFLPCEKQTPKQTVTHLSCADRILNTIPQDVGMPVREQWHVTTS